MKKVLTVPLLIAMIGFPFASYSQAHDPQILQAIATLKGKVGNDFSISWNSQQTRVRTLEGKLSRPGATKIATSTVTPDKIATDFLKSNNNLFKMQANIMDLRKKSMQQSLAGYHIEMEQSYEGLPVFNGGAEVHVSNDSNKAVYLVHNYYLPDINISTTPALSKDEIIEAIKFDILQNYMTTEDITGAEKPVYGKPSLIFKEQPKLELGIYNVEEKPVLVYKVLLDIESPNKLLEYLIDANTGVVIESANLLQNAVGRGYVFDPNPVNTLNDSSLNASSNIPQALIL